MGNAQGKSPEGKNKRRKAKSSKSSPAKEFSPTPKRSSTSNGSVAINSNHRTTESSIHLPLKEYEVPDFLKDTQPLRRQENAASPVVRRDLKDPDFSSRGGQGLMIPSEELVVPEFLRNSEGRQGHEKLRRGGSSTTVINKSGGAQGNARNESRGRATEKTDKQRLPNGVTKIDSNGMRDFVTMNGEHRVHNHSQGGIAPHKPDQETKTGQKQSADFQTRLSRASTVDLPDKIAQLGQNMREIRSSKTSSDTDSDFKTRNRITFVDMERREESGTNDDASLKRKYKKGGHKSKNKGQNGVKDIAEVSQRIAASAKVQMDPGGRRKSNNWPADTDSVQSTSSQSFTEPISTLSSEKDKFSVSVRDHGNLVLKGGFTNGLLSSSGKLPGALNGHGVEDVDSPPSTERSSNPNDSLGYKESSPEENLRKVKRKDSLQAHLRNRITNLEKVKPLPRARYDSDSTTISDHSAFEDVHIFPNSPRRKSNFGLMTLHDLPEDVLIFILSYLSTKDLCMASGVCRKWQTLCWDPVLWSNIQISNYQGSDINKVLRNLLARLAMDTQGYCITVHSIKLNGCELLSDKGLGFVARFCIDLEELDVSGCCCITSKGLHDILLNCQTITHLDTSGCTCVNSISAPVANGFGLGHQGSFLQLRHLDLSDCVAFDDLGLRVVGLSCGLLENLYLRRCNRVTDVGVKHIAQHCRNLKELSVSDCFKVRDFSLKEVAKNCPSLKYLSVAKCPITDTAMKYIGKQCVKLKYLNIRGCEAVSDVGITHIVQNCLKLRSLDAGKCDITDNGLHLIGIHCPQLKKLSIRGCDRVTNTGVRTIAAQCCSVQYLNFQECSLSYETFMYIREHCKNCVIEHTCPAFF
ncbi:F-box/LRR-repeat protein 7-like [Stylophora pistillata]|uniref:F-box/LRR-repeat protein 7 n=1 Tax=Stylophora pistillata TaxID=50429 RepID=A0A2B4RWI6_STYPI|nr:F-box/LRR-repeat protein 7-like [Stylophora pistillata]PFX20605.1 F-box/LRR-repeat protein 7 [Stylophora pistillata]